MDSSRWDGFAFRDGDIVISTPPKCGTTWTQMICALLIFQSTEFPRPLDEMSVWPDALFRPHDDLLAELAAQRHRRFMKTHTPFDGLPHDDRVTYICVGRDPRDTAISFDNHVKNTDPDAATAVRAAAVARGDVAEASPGGRAAPMPEGPGSARHRFWGWIYNDEDVVVGLPAMLRLLDSFWRARHQPNVVLLHYAAMKADLDGTMRGLATQLGIEIPEERWPELVRAAGFDQMKSRAKELAPEIDAWRDPSRFFNRGSNGQWRDLLDAKDLRHYELRVRDLADPDLVTWLHQGSPLS
ncbi:sulfotransferase domain-containing protein [Plantactinospora solaniradicis]|uniref:Sulfotransferase domain-containing protein n=1 Tax=Plantactinospora solaniradicis TaxID=1723736 RepID=A0ABW1KPZ0_9ACTN